MQNLDELIEHADTRYGRMAFLRGDEPIGRALASYGEWAQAEIDLLECFLDEGDCVLDVGAHVGTHSLAFCRFVGDSGQVLALEPQPVLFRILQENIQTNGQENVTTRNAAAGAEQGQMALPKLDYTAQANFGAVRFAPIAAEDAASDSVELITLDSLDLPSCQLIKVDAEGMELAVLDGAVQTIERCRPFLFIECSEFETSKATFLKLQDLDYDVFLAITPAFNSANYKANPDNIFRHACETSLIGLPKGQARPYLVGEQHVFRCRDLQQLEYLLEAAPRWQDEQKPLVPWSVVEQELDALREERQRLAYRCASLQHENHKLLKRLEKNYSLKPRVKRLSKKIRKGKFLRKVTKIAKHAKR